MTATGYGIITVPAVWLKYIIFQPVSADTGCSFVNIKK